MNQLNKIPPQSVDLEKAVLGVLMLDRSAIRIATEYLRPEMFYHQHHTHLYNTITELVYKGQPVDLLTVINKLKDSRSVEKAGGEHYILSLTNSVVSSAHIQRHCQIIVEKYLRREQIRLAGELYNNAFDESTDTFEIMDAAQKALHTLNQTVNQKQVQRIDAVAVGVLQELEQLRTRESFFTGVPSRYDTIDRITCGWQATDLIICAARPAVGKTAFALSLVTNAAECGEPAAIFSLEMGAKQLVKRILAAQSKMFLKTLRDGRLTDEQMTHLYKNGVQKVANMPIYIDDTASLSTQQFKSRARWLVEVCEVKLIVVDYLQLMKSTVGKNASRQQQIGDISRELKIAAKELNVPIIALSQLSRDIEKRTTQVPQLSDLREAGDIEQDADIVFFLYGASEKEVQEDANKARERFVKIAKHRNGELETIRFDFDGAYQRFTDEGAYKSTAIVAQLPPGNFRPIDNSDFPGLNRAVNFNDTDDGPF